MEIGYLAYQERLIAARDKSWRVVELEVIKAARLTGATDRRGQAAAPGAN